MSKIIKLILISTVIFHVINSTYQYQTLKARVDTLVQFQYWQTPEGKVEFDRLRKNAVSEVPKAQKEIQAGLNQLKEVTAGDWTQPHWPRSNPTP